MLAAPRDIVLALGMVVVTLLLRVPTLRQPLVEAHGFRQTQTAYTALLFHEHGIDLLHPEIPVLGKPWSLPFEFPLFQAIAAIVMDLGVGADLAMRATGLAFFALTAMLVFGFVRSRVGRLEALAALCFFTLSPFSLIWSRTSLMEYMATAAAVAWCWATLTYRDAGGRLALVVATLAGTTACLVKITSALFWLAPILLAPAAKDAGGGLRSWVRARVHGDLAIAVAVPLALTAAWVRYSDHVKAMNLQGVHLTSSALETWNFGTISQRLDQSTWTTVFDRIDPSITGGVIWGGLMLAGLLLARQRALWVGVAITVLAPIATFFNLYYVHEYYLCAVTPGIAMLMGIGLVAVLRAAGTREAWLLRTSFAVLAIWAGSTLWLEHPYWALAYTQITPENNSTLATAQSLADVTSPNDLVVIDGYDWSPEVLYYARRRGTMLRWPDPQVLAGLAPGYRAMLIHDPIGGDLQLLREFRWIEPVTPDILRMGETRTDLPPASIRATPDVSLARAAMRAGRQLLPGRELSCTAGTSFAIPPGRGAAWVGVGEGLPDQTRITVDAALAPLPAVAGIVIAPEPSTGVRRSVTLSCAGVATIDITGVRVAS